MGTATTTTATITTTANTTLAGRIWPLILNVLNKFSLREAWRVWVRIRPFLHYQDLIAILVLGWGSVPLGKVLYQTVTSKILQRRSGGSGSGSSTSTDANTKQDGAGDGQQPQPQHQLKAYEETRFYAVVFHLAQAVQLSLLVYCVDLLCLLYHAGTVETSDHHHHSQEGSNVDGPTSSFSSGHTTIDVSLSFAKVVYTLWLARVCAKFKHYILAKYVPKLSRREDKNMDGLIALVDHLINAMIGGVAAMVIIDILELSGLGVRSAFALGSAGTLAITLGTQTLVTHIVSGFTMTTSNRFYVGDFVQLSKGGTGQVTFAGTVESLGWLETTIRGSNDQVTTIPNAQLEGIQVCNLSRNTMCQVRQVLRFKYQDASILPTLLPSIREEIIASCPKIVTDGRRPCRVVWTDYCESHLEVIVDVHFDGIKPIGDAYWNNRQDVLLAIQRAVDKHGVKFAVMESIGRTLQQ